MDIKILREMGLSEGEIKVYLALLKLGESKKSELASQSEVSSSKIYEICERLKRKGLIGEVIKNNSKSFKPMEPRTIFHLLNERTSEIENQKKELEKMMPFLENKLKNEENKAVLYEGMRAIKNFYLNLLEELNKGDEYYIIGTNYGANIQGSKEFFENYHLQRAKKGIKVKMLVNSEVRSQLVKTINKLSEVRFLPGHLISNMIILFYKDKSFIFILSEEPVGILIKNSEITEGFKSYFDAFWKIAKK